jgi:hypothetical protein
MMKWLFALCLFGLLATPAKADWFGWPSYGEHCSCYGGGYGGGYGYGTPFYGGALTYGTPGMERREYRREYRRERRWDRRYDRRYW